jgi:hypothetical protein
MMSQYTRQGKDWRITAVYKKYMSIMSQFLTPHSVLNRILRKSY